MGCKPSADFAQSVMNQIFDDMMEHIEIYFDNILITSQSWKAHISTVSEILQHLETHGFTVNPSKCQWAVKEANWMGYTITPNGYKPNAQKVAAILKISEPTTPKQLRSFLGFANYNKQFYARRAHIFAPLTQLSGIKLKSKFLKQWQTPQKQAFAKAKALMAQDVLLTYPDPNLPFDLETDASDYQLGAILKQNNQILACFS